MGHDEQHGRAQLAERTWGELPRGEFHPVGPIDLEELTECQVCGSGNLELLCDVEVVDVGVVMNTVVCTDCTLVFRAIRPTFEWFEGAWDRRIIGSPHFHDQDEKKQDNRRQRYNRTAEFLESVTSSRSMLDVGSGPGFGLQVFADRGWKARGIEPDDGRARIGREELGLDVATMPAEDLGLDPGRLEVITIIHVLEHMRDPSAVIEACAAALKNGGHLYIEVPDAHANINWGDMTHIEHLIYFDEWSLQRLCAPHGLVARYRAFPRTKPWGNKHLALLFEKVDGSTPDVPPAPIAADPRRHFATLISQGIGSPVDLDEPVHFVIGGVADAAIMLRDRITVPAGPNTFHVHSNEGGVVLRRENRPAGDKLKRILTSLPDLEPLNDAVRLTVNQVAKRQVLADPGFVKMRYQKI